MKIFFEAFLIVALAVVAGGLTKLWHPRAPAWYLRDEPLARNEVTLQQVLEQWAGEVTWVDAREAGGGLL